MARKLIGVVAALTVLAAVAQVNGENLGPTPYLSFSDSPFDGLSFTYFHLEDFEDDDSAGLLNDAPGASASSVFLVSTVYPGFIDSVDADDGVIDGDGSTGDSLGVMDTTLTVTFDETTLGSFPTHVGIVWTDGSDPVSFEAFDNQGASLGAIGPVNIADGSTGGQTAEDRFFGATSSTGISEFRISSGLIVNFEVDHLQYGHVVPEPSSSILAALGLVGLTIWRGRRKR
jgi:hypothetical protein